MRYLTDEQIIAEAEETFDMVPVNYAAATDEIALLKAYIKILKKMLDATINARPCEYLKKFPEFQEFEKSVIEKLTIGNYYVSHFAPHKTGHYDEKDDDGKIVYHYYKLTDEQRLEEALDNLLDDKEGYFDEFITEELHKEIVEFARFIVKDIRG